MRSDQRWTLSQATWAYGAALIVIGMLDAVWLGFIAKNFYRREFGDLMAPSFKVLPAVLFYISFPAALVALALRPDRQPMGDALWRSALVGLVSYGTYDLTNWATLRDWSLKVVAADIIWGLAISTAAGLAAWKVLNHRSLNAESVGSR